MSFCNDCPNTFDVDEVEKLVNEVFEYNEGFVADPKTEESSAEKQSDLLNKIKECRITLDSDIEKLSEDAVLTRLRTRRLIVANNKLSEKTAAIMAENTKLEQETPS